MILSRGLASPDRPGSDPNHDTSWGAKAAAAAPAHRATDADPSTRCAAPAAQADAAAVAQPAARHATAWMPAAVALATAESLVCMARCCCILGHLPCRTLGHRRGLAVRRRRPGRRDPCPSDWGARALSRAAGARSPLRTHRMPEPGTELRRPAPAAFLAVRHDLPVLPARRPPAPAVQIPQPVPRSRSVRILRWRRALRRVLL